MWWGTEAGEGFLGRLGEEGEGVWVAGGADYPQLPRQSPQLCLDCWGAAESGEWGSWGWRWGRMETWEGAGGSRATGGVGEGARRG